MFCQFKEFLIANIIYYSMLENIFFTKELYAYIFGVDYIYNFLQIKLVSDKKKESTFKCNLLPDDSYNDFVKEDKASASILRYGFSFKKKQRILSLKKFKDEEMTMIESLNVNHVEKVEENQPKTSPKNTHNENKPTQPKQNNKYPNTYYTNNYHKGYFNKNYHYGRTNYAYKHHANHNNKYHKLYPSKNNNNYHIHNNNNKTNINTDDNDKDFINLNKETNELTPVGNSMSDTEKYGQNQNKFHRKNYFHKKYNDVSSSDKKTSFERTRKISI